MRRPPGEQIFRPFPTSAVPLDLNLLNLSSPISADVQIDDLGSNSFSDMDDLLSFGMEGFEGVQHSYDPGFISDLVDCPLSLDFTDIG